VPLRLPALSMSAARRFQYCQSTLESFTTIIAKASCKAPALVVSGGASHGPSVQVRISKLIFLSS
jgi:hypothetical protein